MATHCGFSVSQLPVCSNAKKAKQLLKTGNGTTSMRNLLTDHLGEMQIDWILCRPACLQCISHAVNSSFRKRPLWEHNNHYYT